MNREIKSSVHAYTSTQPLVPMYACTDSFAFAFIFLLANSLTWHQKAEPKFNPCDFRKNYHAPVYELHLFVIYRTV